MEFALVHDDVVAGEAGEERDEDCGDGGEARQGEAQHAAGPLGRGVAALSA